MYVLPDELRDLLKIEFGKLVSEEELIKVLKNEKYVVSIGDTVTFTLLKHNILPFFCIVDYKTRRGNCESEVIDKIKSYGEKSVQIDNPHKTITDELWNTIKDAYNDLDNKYLRIEVNGEEDLASLAAIYLAPSDVTIIYGLPNKGVLVVKPTNENKRKVKEILDKM